MEESNNLAYQDAKLLHAVPKLISPSISTQAEFFTDWGSYVYMIGGSKYRKYIHELVEELLKNANENEDDTGIHFLRDLVNELNIQTGRSR